ncbi:hypothetical protein Tco_0804608 [Tanacetum coccineum]|uniref:Uncharacterized protein n=1 Tax=Tanacetum coccineum TaxID=301880 RepID=A0ABQ5A5P0_9ASTR
MAKGNGSGESKPKWNNVQRMNHQNQFVPTAVLTRTGRILVNTARQNSSQAVLTSAARKVMLIKVFVEKIVDVVHIIGADITANGVEVVMEYLVKISKKACILELKRRHLKITVLTSNMLYPSRNIRRICSCTSLKTTKEQDPIRRIQDRPIRVFKAIGNKIFWNEDIEPWSLIQETLDTPY